MNAINYRRLTKSGKTEISIDVLADNTSSLSRHCERSAALIFPGEKLNAFYATRRANYMDVICNLL